MPATMKNDEQQDFSSLEGPVPALDGARTDTAARSWDPYDVWLRRVKQPRDDRHPRRAEAMAARATGSATVDTASHPQLVLPPLR